MSCIGFFVFTLLLMLFSFSCTEELLLVEIVSGGFRVNINIMMNINDSRITVLRQTIDDVYRRCLFPVSLLGDDDDDDMVFLFCCCCYVEGM